MELVYKKEFHEIFEEHSEHAEFAPLLQRMHVVDANGESQMDEDQWEAASTCPAPFLVLFGSDFGLSRVDIYLAFAFEKR